MKIDRVDFTRFDKDRLYPENYTEHNNNNKWKKKPKMNRIGNKLAAE